MTSAIANRNSVSLVVLGALISFWFISSAPVYPFFVLCAVGLGALGHLFVLIRKRTKLGLLIFLPWLCCYVFMLIAAKVVKSDASDWMSEMAKNQCAAIDCVSIDGGQPTLIGGTSGLLITRMGAKVFVRFFKDDDGCRLHSDYFFGGSNVTKWRCQ